MSHYVVKCGKQAVAKSYTLPEGWQWGVLYPLEARCPDHPHPAVDARLVDRINEPGRDAAA